MLNREKATNNKSKSIFGIIIVIVIFMFTVFRSFQIYFYKCAIGRKSNTIKNKIRGVSTYIDSFDGLKLHGYEYINRNSNKHKWAIVVHGYRGDATYMYFITDEFIENGYNVITPDNRGHGKSEGNYIGMGWHDRLDIIEWIKRIIEIDPCAEIVLYGISMGAATVLMVSGEELPSNVKAVISDCGYTSIDDIMAYQASKQYKYICSKITLPFVDKMVKSKAGYTFKEGSALNQVEKTKLPILFIHGDKDDYVPLYMVYELYEKAAGDKELLIIKDAEHAMSFFVNKELYLSNIWKFINRYINEE